MDEVLRWDAETRVWKTVLGGVEPEVLWIYANAKAVVPVRGPPTSIEVPSEFPAYTVNPTNEAIPLAPPFVSNSEIQQWDPEKQGWQINFGIRNLH